MCEEFEVRGLGCRVYIGLGYEIVLEAFRLQGSRVQGSSYCWLVGVAALTSEVTRASSALQRQIVSLMSYKSR